MSDLTHIEKRKFERLLDMGGGYVLDFSNRTFDEFAIDSIGRTIYDGNYGSKANRLRGFWQQEENGIVGKLMGDMLDYGMENDLFIGKDALLEACRQTVMRIIQDSPVRELGALAAISDEKDFDSVAKEDEVCQRLQTIDGIGPVNAVAFKAIIEHPGRFDSNRDVGAYLGMTPRIHASGEVERRGHISRAGSEIMRTYLFEAAQVLLTRTKRMSCLKSWGLRLCKRKPTKLVIAALARKLAVLMLALWKNGTTFQPTREKLSPVMAG